jgi:single-stranded-DNA-specific exonuclease
VSAAARPTSLTAEPYDYADARRIAVELELAEPVAIAIVRRGHRTVEQARAFLDADERHPPSAFAGMADAVGAIRAAIASGRRITVHGDYDVDGICATSILIASLRRLEADCDWLIPDRLGDGYGLSAATAAALRERGTSLLITADCGIASAEEVDALKRDGIDVVVTDHHQPGERLPDCPIVHPEVSSYPFAGLCGAAVAGKLACALEEREGEESDRDLDLVALATVADLVPLVGENRTLVRAGLAELRRARRTGIRALCASAGVEPERLDEGDIAFRLGPRLNAAGRLYRADAGVELMLTGDHSRAEGIAAELEGANRERRETERELTNAAEAALRELPAELREAPAIVLAGEGWHPGVVGIVASRMAERHGKPAVLIGLDGSGRGRGSGRGIPGFDLLGALRACSDHLTRFGGHVAAAGLEIERDAVDAFSRAFAAHARATMPDGPPAPPERIDAVVGVEALDLRLAEQLGRLAPFGRGNPEVRLLVPSTRIAALRGMGEEGRHARFDLLSAGARASGVAFNVGRALQEAERIPHDLTVRLELNHWNGAVHPRAVLAGSPAPAPEPNGNAPGCRCEPRAGTAWWERFDRELESELPRPEQRGTPIGSEARAAIPRAGSAVALVAELLSSGGRVLVACASAPRRSGLAVLAGAGGSFGAGCAIVCESCPEGSLAAAARGEGPPALVLCDWAALAADPGSVSAFDHVVAVDPPALASWWATATEVRKGWVHRAWGPAGGPDRLAELCWDGEWELRPALASIYRGAAASGEVTAERLGELLRGGGRYPRSAPSAARCVRVLDGLGLARLEREGAVRVLRVVSSERTDLERSDAYRAFAARHEEGRRFLESRRAEP